MRFELTEHGREQLKKLVEGICLHDVKATRNSLASLLQNKSCVGPEEDYIVVVLNEAIATSKLKACDDIALAISWLLKAYKHHIRRALISELADGLTDLENKNNPEWAIELTLKESNLPPESQQKFWDNLRVVIEVRQLFRQAGFSTALDERCTPVIMAVKAPIHA